MLKEYYCAIDKKRNSILEHKNNEKWRDFTIEVHSLNYGGAVGADYMLSPFGNYFGADVDIAFLGNKPKAQVSPLTSYKKGMIVK